MAVAVCSTVSGENLSIVQTIYKFQKVFIWTAYSTGMEGRSIRMVAILPEISIEVINKVLAGCITEMVRCKSLDIGNEVR